MISDHAYLWVYLLNQADPVVCGVVAWDEFNQQYAFRYAKSYLQRPDAVPLSIPDCPLGDLVDEDIPLDHELNSVIRDASPDAWGRNVMMREHGNQPGQEPEDLGEIDFLRRAGPDRIGAFDATDSPHEYEPRQSHAAPLEDLLEAADRIDQGKRLDPHLDAALNHGTSVGGARPKALLTEAGDYWIAKFASSKDTWDMVGIEHGSMTLARMAGLDVAETQLASPLNKKVILVKRFDRVVGETSVYRRHMISAMTLLNLDEYEVRRGYSSYLDLADLLRKYARNFGDDGAELFRRMVFNILIGNTDDHARNHACFWDGEFLELTPAYDVCPQPRAGLSADQAMEVGEWGRKSNLQNAISDCERFGLVVDEAEEIIREMVEIVEGNWRQVFADAGVPDGHLDFLSTSTIASESVFYELK